jgi:hypothetical protein
MKGSICIKANQETQHVLQEKKKGRKGQKKTGNDKFLGHPGVASGIAVFE